MENALGSKRQAEAGLEFEVLILIFLENALRPAVKDSERTDIQKVLILIFLENALRHASSVDVLCTKVRS